MAKDPAFLFYPGDWQGGTMYLTHEQKGCYMDLLILQFNQGKFSLAQAKQVLSICFDVAWPTLEQKFSTDGKFYWNDRLKREIEKRQNFSNSRRNNALGSKAHAEHMLKHMENENINGNEIKKVTKTAKAKKDPNAEPYWKELVKIYFSFCFEKFNEKPTFDGSAPHDMHRIIEVLKERAIEANIEWTEQVAKERWRGFLGWAFKDKWLSENWLLSNINSKKDKIFFSINGTYKQIPANGNINGKEGTSEARTRVAKGW